MPVRFFRRGISKARFLPAVAGSSPTRAEINAGVDLSPQVADMGGFSISNAPIETPDLATSFDSQIDGPDATETSSLTMYDLSDSTTIRTAIAKGVSGFVLLMPYGDVPTKRCEVWPVKSTGVNDVWGLDATAAKYQAGFAVTSIPNQLAIIPA